MFTLTWKLVDLGFLGSVLVDCFSKTASLVIFHPAKVNFDGVFFAINSSDVSCDLPFDGNFELTTLDHVLVAFFVANEATEANNFTILVNLSSVLEVSNFNSAAFSKWNNPNDFQLEKILPVKEVLLLPDFHDVIILDRWEAFKDSVDENEHLGLNVFNCSGVSVDQLDFPNVNIISALSMIVISIKFMVVF